MDDREKLVVESCRNKTVLDVGAGGGFLNGEQCLHESISEVARKTIGIDIDEDKVKRARQEGYDVRYGDAQNFNIPQSFEVVFAGALIEHLPSPGSFLDCAKDNLMDGGRLIVTTPNIHSILSLKRYFNDNPCQNHLLGFNRYHLKKLFEVKGFEVLTLKTVPSEKAPTLKSKVFPALLPDRFKSQLFIKGRAAKNG